MTNPGSIKGPTVTDAIKRVETALANHAGEKCLLIATDTLRELVEATRTATSRASEGDGVLAMLDEHIQRCRDAVAECTNWSPAQAEWSRARDALLNFRDALLAREQAGGAP